MKKTAALFLALSDETNPIKKDTDFDGINDYVTMATGGPTGSSNRTVECWIKSSNNIASQQTIVDWGGMSPNGSRFTLNMIYNGKLRIEVGGNGFHTTNNIADGLWHHVAVTYDNSAALKFKLYVDGVMLANQNTTVAVNTSSTGGYYIGTRNDFANYFDGIIDEVRVWNVVRTDAEILASMNGEFCAVPTGLVSYYKMNQGTAGSSNTGVTTLTNATGTNNGTLTNFALSGSSSNWVVGKSLTSGSPSTGNVSLTVCDSYTTSNGTVYTTSGNIVDTLATSAGCDSILNIALTVNQSSTGSLTTTACNKYVSPSGNNTWIISGTYTDVIPNAVGCDSTLTINLTVNTIDTNVLVNGAFLTSYVTGGTYQWLDCNNSFAAIAGATSQVFQATANGSYAVEITKNNCTDTSACYAVANIGLDELSFSNQLTLYPNPTRNLLVINLGAEYKQVKIEIVDITGRQVSMRSLSKTSKIEHKLELPAGVYFVKVYADDLKAVKKINVY